MYVWYVFGSGFVCMSGDMFGSGFASMFGDGICLAMCFVCMSGDIFGSGFMCTLGGGVCLAMIVVVFICLWCLLDICGCSLVVGRFC